MNLVDCWTAKGASLAGSAWAGAVPRAGRGEDSNLEISMPTAKAQAANIIAAFDQAQAELVGKAVILTDGKAGTVDKIWLDERHGLRISIRCFEGRWPVSTIKFAQS